MFIYCEVIFGSYSLSNRFVRVGSRCSDEDIYFRLSDTDIHAVMPMHL